jgi:hypothetical protein
MITLNTGITFLLLTCMHFWVWEIIRRWSACAKSLRNTGLEYTGKFYLLIFSYENRVSVLI